jgi:hypothetical protein
MMMRVWSTLIAGLMLFGLTATADARPAPLADSPACDVPHRTAAAIIEIAGTGDASTPIPDPIPYEILEGIAITPKTGEQIDALLESMVACVNEGDVLGFLSLLSNEFIARHFGEFDLTVETLNELIDHPVPLPADQRLSVVEIWNPTELSDGHYTALVIFDQGEIESPELTSELTFIEVDGQLVVDEWQPVLWDDPSSEDGWEYVQGAGYDGVIAPVDQVVDQLYGFFNQDVQGSWTPTEEQIATLESELPAFLKSAPGAEPDLHERVSGYHRQYFGYVIEGRALIFVNAFCDSFDGDWRSNAVFVMDGGDCFFSVSYDAVKGEFLDLRINGDA